MITIQVRLLEGWESQYSWPNIENEDMDIDENGGVDAGESDLQDGKLRAYNIYFLI